MSLAKDEKAKIVKKFGKSAKDTGSTATQVALLTKRIEELQSHFKMQNKDNQSKTGLIRIVSERKKLHTFFTICGEVKKLLSCLLL